jgi:DNA-binding MarR family transcriptional regulator
MPSTPTSHYALTTKQLVILNLLYRFRFATSQLLAQSTNTNKDIINKRLKLMMELNYIGRKFEPEYHLLRKHAMYYLLPDGIKALKQISDKKYSPKVLRTMTKEGDKSDTFINHHLAVFGLYCALRTMYGDELRFFTKSQLTTFDHYPQPLPDAYIRIGDGDDERQFFLDVIHESQPFFIATRKVMQYVTYADEGRKEWERKTGTVLPSVLLICDSSSLKKRLQKKMRRASDNIEGDDMALYAAAMDKIGDDDGWHDLANPDEALALDDLP